MNTELICVITPVRERLLLHLDVEAFFARLCKKLSINNVIKPRFGISANKSFPPVVAFIHYAHARHALPTPPSDKSQVEDSTLNKVAELCDAIKQTQVLAIDRKTSLGKSYPCPGVTILKFAGNISSRANIAMTFNLSPCTWIWPLVTRASNS